MNRHLLTLGVGLVGVILVGSQLTRTPLVADANDAALQHYQASTILDTTHRVDDEFAKHWRRHELQPAGRAESLQIIRRLSLGLTGTLPSFEEIRALESLPDDQKIPWWLDHLLNDRRYSDYVAERFARAFVGTEEGPFLVFRRRRFLSWLSENLARNRAYDEIVRELISDEGIWTDSPGINFVTVTNGTDEEGQPDPARLAARTTRAFLGVRLDCVQCHDDNTGGDWLQSDFHELAAFFAQARSSGLGVHDVERDYEFTYLGEDEAVVVQPQFPFHENLDVQGTTRRAKLANWVTHPDNTAFARATVNRVWALLFGTPLVREIDHIPLAGPYPPGLETLADDFASSGYDLRRLITQIALTRVFQLDSRSDTEVTSRHEEQWAVFPLTRLRPEQMAGGIVQSASLSTIDSHSHILVRLARAEQVGDFVKRYGDTGEDEFSDRGGTIPQRLVMLNGKLVKERTKDDLFANAATRIAQQVNDDPRALEAAFLCVLSRRPTTDESDHFLSFLKDSSMNRKQQFEDIYWSLLNSTEFSWNH